MLIECVIFIRNAGISWKTGCEAGCNCDKETIKCNKTDLEQHVIDDIHLPVRDFSKTSEDRK